MLGKVMLLKMFEFNHLTNNRLLDMATKLTPKQWNTPLDVGQRSLHETLFHLLVVEEEWVYFCQHGETNFDYRHIEDYPDVKSLRAFSDSDYLTTRAYLESVDEDTLASAVTGRMPPPDDTVRTLDIWYLLTHTLYHSAQHRSEAALMLTRFGHSPGFIDFIGHDW